MNWLSITAALSVTFLTAGSVIAEETKDQPNGEVIPLNKIWAWDMPGTRDIRSLEPESFGSAARATPSREQLQRAERSLVSQTLKPLGQPTARQHATLAFSVVGTGLHALKNAHAVLADNQKPATTFRPDDEISVVFFSRMFGAFVHIEEVQRQRNRVEIRFRFVPHIEAQQTVNFALIPLGKLQSGEIAVDIARLPLDQKFIDMGIAPISQECESRVVCKSFRFAVEDKQ